MATQGGNLSERATEAFIHRRFSYILRELRDFHGSVLVIGSGDGCFEELLRKQNSTVTITSIDLNESFKDRVGIFADKVIIDDFITHKFTDTFDCLVSVDVIEHIVHTDAFLKKAYILMNPEAVFYLQTPNLASWHGRLSLLLGYLPAAMEVSIEKNYFGKTWPFRYDEPIHHVRVFTAGALRELCVYHGYKVVRMIGVDQGLGKLFYLFPNIAGSICIKLTK